MVSDYQSSTELIFENSSLRETVYFTGLEF